PYLIHAPDPALPGVVEVAMLGDPGVHGDARGNRGVDAAGRTELRDRYVDRRARLRVVGDAGTLLTEDQQAIPRQCGVFDSRRTGHVVDGDDGQTGVRGEGQQVGGGVVVAQALVAVGHHGATPVPASTADDVHGVDGEGVGSPHDCADVRVVAEVLDRHMERVPPFVYVGDDRVARPVPVGVN